MTRYQSAKLLKWAAVVLLIPIIALYALFGFGEAAGGDMSGLVHLIPAVLLLACVVLAWKSPKIAGILMLIIAVIAAIVLIAFQPGGASFMGVGLTAGPFMVGGVLLLLSALFGRQQPLNPA